MQNVNVLTERQREIWTTVEEYKKKNPDTSNMAALKALDLNPSTYAAAKKRMLTGKGYTVKPRRGVEVSLTGKRKYTRRPKMLTLPVEETTHTTNVVAFVGEPKGVVQSVREFLRGN